MADVVFPDCTPYMAQFLDETARAVVEHPSVWPSEPMSGRGHQRPSNYLARTLATPVHSPPKFR